MKYKIPYGRENIEVELNETQVLGIIEGKKIKADFDLEDIKITDNLTGKKILIAIPDKTRKAHLDIILPKLISELKNQGADLLDTKIIIALGLHDAHNEQEIKELVGNIDSEVINHNKNHVAYLDKTSLDVPVYLNKHLLEANYIITIGLVEPHLYAGFSGGPKTVSIGLAGEKTISATHSWKFLSQKGVALGEWENNPFNKTLWEIAAKVGINFSINIVNDNFGNLLKIFAGETRKVYKLATKYSAKTSILEVKKKADVVIAGVGYPKDINLYQASRAFNYVLNVADPILKKGGKLIVFAELSEGVGKGLGEKRFYKSAIDGFKVIKTQAGDHRAFMVKAVMEKGELIFISSNAKKFEPMPFKILPEFDKSLIKKSDKIYIIPKSLSVICQKNAA